MKFTYIIPFKFTEDRFLTLQKVLKNIENLNCETIVIEQGDSPILTDRLPDFNGNLCFLKNTLPFNKSWSLNVAWKKAQNDIIIFGDADNLIDPEILIESINQMNEYEFISPHKRLVDLSPDENNLEFKEIFTIQRPGRGELDHQKLPLCGAMTIFRKEALEEIGGWPEEFFGWGAEDDAMSIKVKYFLKWKELDNKCYHLYHERFAPEQNWYMRNFNIYQWYSTATKEQLKQYIDSTKPLIGDKNRKFE